MSNSPILAACKHRPEDEIGAAGKVDRDARQRLVHRLERIGEAGDAAGIAQRLADRLAERDAGVLDRVMRVDMQVALGRDVDVDQRMPRDLVQHMIEEADAGRNVRYAGPVEIDADLDGGFFGFAGDLGFAHEQNSRILRPRYAAGGQ